MKMRMVTAAIVACLALGAGPGFAGPNSSGIAVGSVTVFDGTRISIASHSTNGDLVTGVVTVERGPYGVVTIALDCQTWLPSGNATTIGGDLRASGTAVNGTRYHIRLVDQFGMPPAFGGSVGVSSSVDPVGDCGADRVLTEPITSGDFLFVRPAT